MNRNQMFVKPAAGVKVRDPHTKKHLPSEGSFVRRDAYWLRRIADRDIVEQTSAPTVSTPSLN